jgi:sulfhydrogenase subunit alpha
MSLSTPMLSPGPGAPLASSWFGGRSSPVAAAGLALIATPRHVLAGTEPEGRGRVVGAMIGHHTGQNQGAIEADLAAFAPSVLDLPQAEAVHRLEMLIRAYDPCISCATHFLDLRIVEDGA